MDEECTYGDHFVRELRGAGLQFTPLEPPKGTPQVLIREIPERDSP